MALLILCGWPVWFISQIGHFVSRQSPNWLDILCILPGLAYATLVCASWIQRWTMVRTIKLLLAVETKESVGSLLQAFDIAPRPIARPVRNLLVRMLPTLTAADFGLLSSEQQQILCKKMKTSAEAEMYSKDYDAELAIAGIRALEQIGDHEAIWTLRNIADSAWHGKKQPIADAARVCLAVVERRAQEQASGRLLLRAADAPVDQSESLLRPSHGTTSSETETLLRSATAEEIG